MSQLGQAFNLLNLYVYSYESYLGLFKHHLNKPQYTRLKPMSLDNIKRESGAPTRTRTADLLITNQLLYQLSYRGTLGAFS